MAVLAKIRQRSLFLIIIIALALFSFVLADVIKGGGFNRDSNNVGTVDGDDIPYQEFRVMVENVNKSMGGNNKSSVYAANYVWDQEVRRRIIAERYEELGLSIGADLLLKKIQEDPSIGQNQLFLNDAGQFDQVKFKDYIANIKATNSEQWSGWKKYEQQIEHAALEKMYFDLIKSGIATTSNEAKTKYQFENDKVSFEYVAYPFSAIVDSTITVTNQEIEVYVQKNKNDFKSEATSTLKYVYIEDKPSVEDIAEVNKKMNLILKGGEQFENGEKLDKPAFRNVTRSNIEEFVNVNSDIKFDSTYFSKDNLPQEFKEQLFGLSRDSIFGPYELNGYTYVSKKIGQKDGGQVKSSHILVSYKGSPSATPSITRTKEEAKVKAQELLAKVKADGNLFATLAMTDSDEPNAGQGGDLGFATPGKMVKPFNDFIFGNPVGTIGLVETEFGFHVVKVTEKQAAVQLATIGLKVETSEATSNKLYNDVSNFEMKASEGDFDKIAKEMKFEVKEAKDLKILDENLPEVGAEREIVKWAFNEDTSIGDIKKFNTTKGYVIAKLTALKEKGTQNAEQAEAVVKPILIKQKKTAMAKAKMAGNFEAIKKVANVQSGTASSVSVQSPYIPNAGSELKVVAHATVLENNKTSVLLEGNTGVYMIKVIGNEKAINLPDYTSYKIKEQSKRANASEAIYKTLKDKAEVTDNRHKFY